MAYINGNNASIFGYPQSAACVANSFGVNVTQSTDRALAFGERYASTQGFAIDWSVQLSGFLQGGGTGPVTGMVGTGSGSSYTGQTGSVFTGTFGSGDTLSGTFIQSSVALNASREKYSTFTISGVGNGSLTESWS
jgi:hypothetical protein